MFSECWRKRREIKGIMSGMFSGKEDIRTRLCIQSYISVISIAACRSSVSIGRFNDGRVVVTGRDENSNGRV